MRRKGLIASSGGKDVQLCIVSNFEADFASDARRREQAIKRRNREAPVQEFFLVL